MARPVYFPLGHAFCPLVDGLLKAYPQLQALPVAATALTRCEVHTRYSQLGTGANPLPAYKLAHTGHAPTGE